MTLPQTTANLHTVLHLAGLNELTQQAASERIAQLLATWGLEEGELNAAIDRRVALAQDQRRIINEQIATLNYIRERSLSIHRSRNKEKVHAQA